MDASSDAPLLTVDDLRRMVAERDDFLAKARAADDQVQLVRKFIGEERFLAAVGEGSAESPFETQAPNPYAISPSKAATVTSIIRAALDRAPEGVTYDDLRDRVREAGIGGYSPNTLFNAVAKLVQLGEAVKLANRIYSKGHYASLSQEKLAELRSVSRRLNTPDAILKLMETVKGGIGAGEVIELLAESYPYIKGNAAYAALSRMTKDRVLKRDGEGRYSLFATEPSGGSSLSGDSRSLI